jgi:EmrB/QacA subfamily drug resistance transporter
VSPRADFFNTEAAERVRPGHVLLVMSMVNVLAAFLTSSINIALPTVEEEFHLGPVALGWIPLCYILAAAVVLVPFGRIADWAGRRLIFVIGLLIMFVATLAVIFVNTYLLLIIFRVMQGLGSGMVFASSTAAVTLAYPRVRRGFAMGVMAMAAYLGQAIGPPIGGILVHNFGWRSIFVFGAIYGAVNLILDAGLLRRAEWKDPKPSARFDWAGSVAYGLSLCAFLLGLSWLPLVAGLVLSVIGIVGLAGFVWWESRMESPVFEVKLFRHNRLFALSNLTALISYASAWGMTFLMSLYLQLVRGLNAEEAGLLLIVGVVLQTAVSPFGGRLADKVQPRWVVSGGMALCALGLGSFTMLGFTTPYWAIVVALCALGLGYAFFSGPNQSAIMSSVERHNVGVASASVGTMRVVGQAMSIALATLVLAVVVGRHEFTAADNANLLTGIRISYGIMAVLAALSVVASLARGDVPAGKRAAEPAVADTSP